MSDDLSNTSRTGGSLRFFIWLGVASLSIIQVAVHIRIMTTKRIGLFALLWLPILLQSERFAAPLTGYGYDTDHHGARELYSTHPGATIYPYPCGTPGTGVNLWGESPLPLYMNPVNVSTLTQVLAKGKGGTVRNCLKEAGAQS